MSLVKVVVKVLLDIEPSMEDMFQKVVTVGGDFLQIGYNIPITSLEITIKCISTFLVDKSKKCRCIKYHNSGGGTPPNGEAYG